MQVLPAGSQHHQPLLTIRRGFEPLLNPRQSLARTKKENRRNRRFPLCFGIAGRRDEVLYGCAEIDNVQKGC